MTKSSSFPVPPPTATGAKPAPVTVPPVGSGAGNLSGRKSRDIPLTLDYFFERSIPEPNSGCWIWLNAVSSLHGYGAVRHEGKTHRAHRLSYEISRGVKVPSSLDVCHRCDVRCCVNPDHLFVGTRRDNMQDCLKKGRMKRLSNLSAEDCPASKLTAQQVLAIRLDNRSQRALGRAYGVDKGTISCIKRGLTWRSI